MIEKLLEDLYRIRVPLPDSPLREINSYVIKGGERTLIIDTGMNRDECYHALLSGLEKLDVNLEQSDFFITHLHADHLGLVERLTTENTTVYFSQKEAALFHSIKKTRDIRFQELFRYYLANGFPIDELKAAVERHPGLQFRPKIQTPFHVLTEGDIIRAGKFIFKCIETPGHSPGHMCLYEAEEKILVAGDHILFDITPNITRWPEFENPLKDYLESLDKVYDLDVRLVLPGHRALMNNHRGRINTLRNHYEARLNEILARLDRKGKTAWQIASEISWDIDVDSWEQFPVVQKWFAIGETIAHLNHLEVEGKIRVNEVDHKRVYSMTKTA